MRNLRVLIIDEVSMCPGEMFEMISVMLSKIRNDARYAVFYCSPHRLVQSTLVA